MERESPRSLTTRTPPVWVRPRGLRVLAVNTLFPNPAQPTWGIFNAYALEHLAEVAHVRVIAPVKWFPGLGLISKKERELNGIPDSAEYRGMVVTHPRFFRTPGFGRQWHGWLYGQSVRRHLLKTIELHRPDVLLASWTYPDGYAVAEVAQRLGIPLVIKCLGSDVHQYLRDQKLKPLVLEALGRARRIVTVSDGLKHLLTDCGIRAEKIDRVYNGVDRGTFHPQPRGEARKSLHQSNHGKIILCVANLLPIKRHADLLRAFALLHRRQHIDSRLVLVGDGPQRQALNKQARTLQIEHQVQFAGSCTHDVVSKWFNASDAVALASANEGLPNVLVEALACGRPVVATRVGGIPELVSSSDYGRLVEVGDVEGMAAGLSDVLGRPWSVDALCACPQVISWEESTLQLYDSLKRACEEPLV